MYLVVRALCALLEKTFESVGMKNSNFKMYYVQIYFLDKLALDDLAYPIFFMYRCKYEHIDLYVTYLHLCIFSGKNIAKQWTNEKVFLVVYGVCLRWTTGLFPNNDISSGNIYSDARLNTTH